MLSMNLSTLMHDTIALITILNPLAAASIMISMVAPANVQTIRPIALKATVTVLLAGIITLYTGEYIFKFFGINVQSIKVIGGIILMMIAINMAYGQAAKSRHSPEEQEEAEEKEDISVVPLGIPILFGPGVIATIIVLNHNNIQNLSVWQSYGLLTLSIALSAVVVYLTLRYAIWINRILGITGMKILTRIMGLVVGAIAAQFILSGAKGLWQMF